MGNSRSRNLPVKTAREVIARRDNEKIVGALKDHEVDVEKLLKKVATREEVEKMLRNPTETQSIQPAIPQQEKQIPKKIFSDEAKQHYHNPINANILAEISKWKLEKTEVIDYKQRYTCC